MTRAPDKLGDLMIKDVATMGPDSSVDEAVRVMVDRGIGSVVIVEEDNPVGIFTERDFLRAVVADSEVMSRSLRDAMTAPPVTIGPEAEVFDAFEVMTAKGIRRLPVVDGGRLVGIVAERDLLRWVRDVGNE